MTTPNNTKAPRVAFWLRAMEVQKHRLTREYRKSLKDEATNGHLRRGHRHHRAHARADGAQPRLGRVPAPTSTSVPATASAAGHGFAPGFGFGPGGFRSGREFRRAFRKNAMMHGFGHQPHPASIEDDGPAEEAPKA